MAGLKIDDITYIETDLSTLCAEPLFSFYHLTRLFLRRANVQFEITIQYMAQRFHIHVPFRRKIEIKLFRRHQPISFTAAISPVPPARSSLLARWNSGKYADSGYFAGKVDRGQIWLFFFPASSALGYKHRCRAGDRGEKKGEESSTPSPPLSIHLERNSTHLGISVVESNK